MVVVSVGGEDVDAALRRCLAMGADRGVRVELDGPADPFTVARALAGVVTREQPDLVFTGSHCPQCKHALSAFDNTPLLIEPTYRVNHRSPTISKKR